MPGQSPCWLDAHRGAACGLVSITTARRDGEGAGPGEGDRPGQVRPAGRAAAGRHREPGPGGSLVGEDIAGPSVQITARVATLARPAEILVSRTVKELVTGSGIIFAERGSYALDEPPDQWPLFAVTGFAAAGPHAHDSEPG